MRGGRERAEKGVCSLVFPWAQQGREELEAPVGCSCIRKLHAHYMFLFPLGHGAALRRI